MTETITNEIKNANIKELMTKLAGQSIDSKMASNANKYGAMLRDVLIYRVKLVQAPKFDAEKFQTTLYSGIAQDFGTKVEQK